MKGKQKQVQEKKDEEKMDVVIKTNGKHGKDHNSKGVGGQKKEAQKKKQGHNLKVKFYRIKGKQKQVKQNIGKNECVRST